MRLQFTSFYTLVTLIYTVFFLKAIAADSFTSIKLPLCSIKFLLRKACGTMAFLQYEC